MAENKTCQSKNHKMHICAMKAAGYDKTRAAEYKKIMAQPRYRCDNCGARVHDSVNVCKPVKM